VEKTREEEDEGQVRGENKTVGAVQNYPEIKQIPKKGALIEVTGQSLVIHRTVSVMVICQGLTFSHSR
jgi:hypothetical protein